MLTVYVLSVCIDQCFSCVRVFESYIVMGMFNIERWSEFMDRRAWLSVHVKRAKTQLPKTVWWLNWWTSSMVSTNRLPFSLKRTRRYIPCSWECKRRHLTSSGFCVRHAGFETSGAGYTHCCAFACAYWDFPIALSRYMSRIFPSSHGCDSRHLHHSSRSEEYPP